MLQILDKKCCNCCHTQKLDITNEVPAKTIVNDSVDSECLQILEKRMWFQYYKLHVVGYSKFEDEVEITEEMFFSNSNESNDIEPARDNTNEIKDQFTAGANAHDNDTDEVSRQDDTLADNQALEDETEITNDVHNDQTTSSHNQNSTQKAQPNHNVNKRCNSCRPCCYSMPRSNWQLFFLIILGIAQYLAQLAAIPLLIVQMFDTYTLLCIGEKKYCSEESVYDLQLDKAAIALAFYLCLGVSFLTSALMKWDPWPKQ